MHVDAWANCVAFITAASASDAQASAKSVGRVWRGVHARDFLVEDEDDEVDEDADEDIAETSLRGRWSTSASAGRNEDLETQRRALPNWDRLLSPSQSQGDATTTTTTTTTVPPCFIAQVAELPRAAGVEWAAFGISFELSTGGAGGAGGSGSVSYTKQAGWDVCTVSVSTAAKGSDDVVVLKVASCTVADERELGRAMDEMSARDGDSLAVGLVEVFTTSRSVLGKGEASVSVQVVPCMSVWSMDGEAVFAAVRYRCHV